MLTPSLHELILFDRKGSPFQPALKLPDAWMDALASFNMQGKSGKQEP